MMKNSNLSFQNVMMAALLLVGSCALSSCTKTDPEPTIDKVVNLAPVASLKAELIKAATLEDLPSGLKSAAATIGNVLSENEINAYYEADLNKEVAALQANLSLSAEEITALKANDPYAFWDIIVRMTKGVSFATEAELAGHHVTMQSNPLFTPYLASASTSSDNMYATNYYKGALDLQKYMRDFMLPMLQVVQNLKGETLKAGTLNSQQKKATEEQKKSVATVVAVVLVQSNTIKGQYTANGNNGNGKGNAYAYGKHKGGHSN